MFDRVAEHHGNQCVGLALGVRALHLANELLGLQNSPENVSISASTKKCITEPFQHLLGIPRERIHIAPTRHEILTIVKGRDCVNLQLTKHKFPSIGSVFAAADSDIFLLVERKSSHS